MELKLEEAAYFDFVTHHPTTGAATDADSTPTAEVFEDATDTTVVALTVTKRTSKTGNYRVPVTAAAADGFEVGKTYNVVASATVNSIAAKGVIGRFKVRTRGKDNLAYPATSGRSLAVDASGRIDLGSWLGSAPNALQSGRVDAYLGAVASGVIAAASFASNALDAVWSTATRVLTAATNITSTGGTTVPQTGDAYARLGAPVGASISADVAGVQADTNDIQTRLPAALVSGRIDASVGAMASDTITATALAASAVTEIQSGLSTLDAAGVRTAVGLGSANLDTQLGDLPTNAELATALAGADDAVLAAIAALNNLSSAGAQSAAAAALTAYGAALQSTLLTVAGYIDTEVAAIKAKTDNIPASPAAVSDIPTAAQNADKILGRNLGGGSDGGRTVQDALRASRNRVVIDGSTITVYTEDDATPAWVGTVVRADLDGLQEVNPS